MWLKLSGHDHEFGEHEPLNLDELRARLEAEEAERALGGVADGRKDGEETDVEVAPVAPTEEGEASELVQGGATVARGPKAAAASGAAAHPGPEHAKDPRLIKMGLQTALAIGIHNFPEGLATFVATLDDPRVGAGLAVAIAIAITDDHFDLLQCQLVSHCAAVPPRLALRTRCSPSLARRS